MDDVAAMAVVDGGEDLLDDVGSVLLAEVAFLRDAFEELAAVAEPNQGISQTGLALVGPVLTQSPGSSASSPRKTRTALECSGDLAASRC